MEPNNLRYFIYLRKSTDTEDRQIQSIEDQKRELERLSKQLSIKISGIYQENRSAKAPGRPEFGKMLAEIRAGKADGILCWKVNRLSRNPVDGGEIQWLLQQEIIKSILTPSREYRTEDNVMMMSVELGMANQFILDLSKDVKRGMLSKAEKGWRPGLAPIGYRNDRFEEKGNKKVLVDEEKFPIVRKLWDLMLTGNYSVPQINEIANNQLGLRTKYHRKEKRLSVSHAYRILRNPFYYGEYSYMGTVYKGKHKTMITTEEYDRVQKLLGNKGRPRPKTKKLPFSGIIRCGFCGCSIVGDEKVKYVKSESLTRSYLYHRCSHRKPGVKCIEKAISGKELEKQIIKILDEITIPESFLSFALEILNSENASESHNRGIILTNQQDALKECLKKIDNLINLYISPQNSERDLLSDLEFKEQKTILLKEKARINRELEKLSTDVDEWLELTEKTFKFATYAREHFLKGSYDVKNTILRTLGSNYILKDRVLTISLDKEYQIISNSLKTIASENPTLELTDFALDKTKKASFEAISIVLSG
jgi:DNA invertase Pin-like site-specific DNA recombinase